MQFSFDTAHLFAKKNGQSLKIGSMQDMIIEIERELTLERLAFQVPIKAAHSETRLKGKAKLAKINGYLFADIFFGQALSAGSTKGKDGQAETIPATPGPYTISITPPSGGTYALDMGVRFSSDGQELTNVVGVPAAGQYSQSGSIYTFSAADQGKAVLVSYTYTLTSGKSLSIANPYWLEAPSFEIVAFTEYNCKQVFFRFPACVSEHLSIAMPLENWSTTDFRFEVISDPSGFVGLISTAE